MYVKRSDYCCMDDDDDDDNDMTIIEMMIMTETQSSVNGHGIFTW